MTEINVGEVVVEGHGPEDDVEHDEYHHVENLGMDILCKRIILLYFF